MSVPRRRGRKAKKTILEEYGEEREKVLEKLGGSKAAPFPRDAVQEALVLDAKDRTAAKKRALVEDVPPPPVFDPFEDNLVCGSVREFLRHRRDSCPSDEIVGGFISGFEAIRTASMLRAGPGRRRPEDSEYFELRAAGHLCGWIVVYNVINRWRHCQWYRYCG